jgi:hypothetical protein
MARQNVGRRGGVEDFSQNGTEPAGLNNWKKLAAREAEQLRGGFHRDGNGVSAQKEWKTDMEWRTSICR